MKNKNTKRVLFNFMPYECTAAEEFLEEKAKEGWLLSSIRGNILKFKRIEPKNLKYTVDILDGMTMFDDEDNEISLDYREYCREAGWKYVCSKGKVQIFYTEDYLNYTPIHTDAKEKFINVVKASMWNLIGYVMLVAMWMFIMYLWLVEGSMLERILSSNVMLICVAMYIGMIFYYSIEVLSFIKWWIKSRKSLKQNKFLPYNSYKSIKRKNKIYKVSLILYLFLIGTAPLMDESFSNLDFIWIIIGYIIFAILIYLVIRFLKKKNFKKATNISILCISAIIAYIIFMRFMSFSLFNGIISDEDKIFTPSKGYITVEDFGYEETSNDIYGGKSIIAESRSYFSRGDEVDFSYDTFISNNKWIFNMVVNKEIDYYSKLAREFDDKNYKLEIIDTNLPSDVKVYSNNKENRKKYYIVGRNKTVDADNDFEELSEEEFLAIVYKKCFSKEAS